MLPLRLPATNQPFSFPRTSLPYGRPGLDCLNLVSHCAIQAIGFWNEHNGLMVPSVLAFKGLFC